MSVKRSYRLFLTTDHRYALSSPQWSFLRKLGHREQKSRKCQWAEKILGVEYCSASNFGTHRDKCFVGWNCAFLTLRQNGRHVFPPTFWDEQETLDALPFIFCHFPTNRYLSKKFQTPALVKKRAGHLKFLSRLKKLEAWSDICFAWKSKMRPNNDMVAHRPERNYNEKKSRAS